MWCLLLALVVAASGQSFSFSDLSPGSLAKDVLQTVSFVSNVTAHTATLPSQVYLKTSASACTSITSTASTTSTALSPIFLTGTVPTANFDTKALTAGTYRVCYVFNASTVYNTALTPTIFDFQTVTKTIPVVSSPATQLVKLICNPTCETTGAQIYLTTGTCLASATLPTPSSTTSPASTYALSDFGWFVVTGGLTPVTGYGAPYTVCYRTSTSNGWVTVNNNLNVTVTPTPVVQLFTSTIGLADKQVITVNCLLCASTNQFYLQGSAPCSTSTTSPSPSTSTSQAGSPVLAYGNSTWTWTLNAGQTLGVNWYRLCWRQSSTSAWQDTTYWLTLLGSPVTAISQTVLARSSSQMVQLTCPYGCASQDKIYITRGTCDGTISSGPAMTDAATLDATLMTTVNAQNLNPGSYRLCWKSVSSTTYQDSQLMITVTGSSVTSVTPLVLPRSSTATITVTCFNATNSNNFKYPCDGQLFITTQSCTVNVDPVASALTSARVDVVQGVATISTTSLMIETNFKVCFRPTFTASYSDTAFVAVVRATSVRDATPVNLIQAKNQQVKFTCSTDSCPANVQVYLSRGFCFTPCAAGAVCTEKTTVSMLSSNIALIDTSSLYGGEYRLCVNETGIFQDSTILFSIRVTPVTQVMQTVISNQANQQVELVCIGGCSDGDFLYITQTDCIATPTDPVPSTTVSAKASLSAAILPLNAANLQPFVGYKLCYRSQNMSYIFTGFTFEVRGSAVRGATPRAIPISTNPQTLQLDCGYGCTTSDSAFVTSATACTGLREPSPSPWSSGKTQITTIPSPQLTIPTVNLLPGTYYIIYKDASWTNSTTAIQVLPTPVAGVTTAISKALLQAVVLDCPAGCANTDLFYLTSETCLQGVSSPIASGTTSTTYSPLNKVLTIDAVGLTADTSYRVCYRNPLLTNSYWTDTGLNITVKSIQVVDIYPKVISRAIGQGISLNCTSPCPDTDKVFLALTTCSTASTSTVNLNSRVAVVDASGLTVGSSYKVCYQATGANIVDSGLTVTIKATPVTGLMPNMIYSGASRTAFWLTCRLCQQTDFVALTTGTCTGVAQSATASSTSTGAIQLASTTAFISVNTQQLSTGVYNLCHRTATGTFTDAGFTVTIAARPTCTATITRTPSPLAAYSVSTSSFSNGTTVSTVTILPRATTTTFAIVSAGATALFSFGAGNTTTGLTITGTSADNFVATMSCQTLTFPVGYTSLTGAGRGWRCGRKERRSLRYQQAFSGLTAGVRVVVLQVVSCVATVLTSSGTNGSALVFDVPAALTAHKMNPLADLPDIGLQPVLASDPTGVALTPASANVGVAQTFTFTGTTDGDFVGFSTSADCSTLTVAAQTVAGSQVSATFPSAGTWRVCYRNKNSGNFAALTQTVTASTVVTATPVASSSSSSGLSGGAIAGIVVGSTVGGLIIIGLIGYAAYSSLSSKAPAKGRDVSEVSLEEQYYTNPNGYASGYPGSYPVSYPGASVPSASYGYPAPTPATTPLSSVPLY